ncbi:triose-phosphate isomerase [Desulfoferrobacter suflitae]|uniref:triose-phosphate isomerase n=1 Tax=Desulfoferrobacter suflitae TaxID=2865782 RepID=UPI002164C318|nr:triose-phosphate isomerase [Desulfoferrobacter suflitae]MCK8600157.1 triose-phosphate isomerase [Desulfoferrobacter suflitae]
MKPRKTLIAANWKMHKLVHDAVVYVKQLQQEAGVFDDREVLLAPPFTALPAVRIVMERNDFKLGAQNCHWEEQGAYTGEISCGMLKDAGCDYVLVGHSERRHIFGETDDMIRRKVNAAFKHKITPVLCIGEVLEEREAGKTLQVLEDQLKQAVTGLTPALAEQLVVAYEPVWAIGTGKTATPETAQEAHGFIRKQLAAMFDKGVANAVRILYGGSVKPDNVDALMARPDIDGLLVGGASLEVASFKRIVHYQVAGGKN